MLMCLEEGVRMAKKNASSIVCPFRTWAEAVKQLGEEEATAALIHGYKSQQYHKRQNNKNQELLSLVKNDKTGRFKDILEKAASAK
jgi:hypothetical protein